MRLTFHGAAQSVTGSKHLIEVNGLHILLDCGLVQGRRADSYADNVKLPFDPASIDLLILSHAHIDHSGNIPNLVKNGFKGDILCTPATRDLCAAMLPDSGHIQERDVEFLNKRKAKRGEPPIEPIYTQEDALACLDAFMSMSYGRRRQIAPHVYLTFHDAGHMLGSAIVELEIVDTAHSREYRLVFSGDLGRKGSPILRDPALLERADLLILESTYGDRLHPPIEDAARQLEHVLRDTFKRGGSVIIPAFAVGRTQTLVYALNQLYERGDLPNMPVFVDSPLAVDATSAFILHPECYDEETRAFLTQTGDKDPFGFERLTYIRKLEESKRLNFDQRPMIIISASGMAEFGRVVHHLANRIDDPKNTVLIVGWQAENTLGRKLVDGEKRVRILGEELFVKAQIATLNGFSGHADRDELTAWVGAMKQRPRHTYLVHGELPSAQALQDHLKEQLHLEHVHIPARGQAFEV